MDSTWARVTQVVSTYMFALAILGVLNYATGTARTIWFSTNPGDDSSQAHAKTGNNIFTEFPSITSIAHHRYLKADQAEPKLSLSGSFANAFNWNTNQLFFRVTANYKSPSFDRNEVVIWDYIMPRSALSPNDFDDLVNQHLYSDNSTYQLSIDNVKSKYPLRDHSVGNLQDREVTFRVDYQYMPIIGFFKNYHVGQLDLKLPHFISPRKIKSNQI